MKYLNANLILPDSLVEELQKYVQAGYIYVPAKNEQHKSWGNGQAIGKNLQSAMRKLFRNIKIMFPPGNLLSDILFPYMP